MDSVEGSRMKDLLLQYCRYNVWANDRLFDATMQLDMAAHMTEVESSFPSIYQTWLHIWSGQYLWMARLTDGDVSQRPQKVFTGSMDELREGLQASAREWIDWVQGADHSLLEGLLVVEGRSATAEFVRRDIVMQVMNHGTYHRGQIVTLLRQLGATDLPSTDFVRFANGEP